MTNKSRLPKPGDRYVNAFTTFVALVTAPMARMIPPRTGLGRHPTVMDESRALKSSDRYIIAFARLVALAYLLAAVAAAISPIATHIPIFIHSANIIITFIILITEGALWAVSTITRSASQLRHALRQTGAAALLALAVWIGGQSRGWQAEDWLAALIESPQPTRYGFGLVVAATRMRLYDLGGLLVKAARWVLASNRRTWWPLGSLLTLAAVNIHLSQGWGSAFYTLPTIVGFHTVVEWLRHRWGIELKPKLSAGDPGRDQ